MKDIAAHKAKMEWKRSERPTWNASPRHIPANLSRRHPDYGCTLVEHLARKAARPAQTGADHV